MVSQIISLMDTDFGRGPKVTQFTIQQLVYVLLFLILLANSLIGFFAVTSIL